MFEGLLTSLNAIKPFALKTAAILFLVGAALLTIPTSLLIEFSLAALVQSSRTFISLMTLFSFFVIVVEAAIYVGGMIRKYLEKGKYKKFLKYQLERLSSDEKSALKNYLENDLSNYHFPLSGGVAKGLVGKGILSQSSNLGLPGSGDLFPFMIQPVALEILRKNRELLD